LSARTARAIAVDGDVLFVRPIQDIAQIRFLIAQLLGIRRFLRDPVAHGFGTADRALALRFRPLCPQDATGAGEIAVAIYKNTLLTKSFRRAGSILTFSDSSRDAWQEPFLAASFAESPDREIEDNEVP